MSAPLSTSPLAQSASGDYVTCVTPRQERGHLPKSSAHQFIEKDAMRGYKDQDTKERLARAAEARQKALEKFKARPGPDDPEVIRRRQEREAIAAAREVREAERKVRKDKEAARRAELEAKGKVGGEEREKREAIEKETSDAAETAERKAERDRRYAARKARQGKK